MFGHADWTHARPAATVGDAEGLVQVQMTDICAHIAGPAESTCAFMLAPSM